MSEPFVESYNHARTGLFILGGIAVAGLLLLLGAQAQGGPEWMFNAFLLISIGVIALYVKVVYRSQQSLRVQVEGTERRREEIETTLVRALDRLRAGDLVNCSGAAGALPDRLSLALSNATNALDVLAQQIQSSSIEVASAANSVNEIASELASGSSEQAASVVEITADRKSTR